MPPRNERVAAMVQRELARNVQVGNAVLLAKAAEIDRGVRRLSPRQFHATYRLPALRQVHAASAPKPPKAAPVKAKPAVARTAAPSPAPTPAVEAKAPDTVGQAEPTQPTASHAPSHMPSHGPSHGPSHAPSHAPSSSKALARPHAAEREAVRAILQLVAREALTTEDRASFVRLLDSLDERAAVILGLFGRS